MKVTLLPGDKGGCAFHRMRLPAGIAKAHGMDIEVLDQVPGKKFSDGSVKIYPNKMETDVIVLQRPVHPAFTGAIPGFQEQGIAVVVELDDDLRSLPKNHQGYKHLDPLSKGPLSWYNLDIALETCDYATFTTSALADKYGRPGRHSIIPNFIPLEITEIEYKPPMHAVGWTSSVATHPNDLQVTGGGVARAVEEAKADIYVLGDPTNVAEALSCSDTVLVKTPGWVDQVDYYYYLRGAKVGIAPLDMTPFNQAKSNLKGLEFSAIGVPFVASPTDPYLELFTRGAGLIARTPKEWYSRVHMLLTDESIHKTVSECSREVVTEHYLLEDHWHLYPEAWEKALKLRRSRISN